MNSDKVSRKQFENENTEEKLVKKTPTEGVNMEEDKKKTDEDEEAEKAEEDELDNSAAGKNINMNQFDDLHYRWEF